MGPSPNLYGPPVWKKSQVGDAESGADFKLREQHLCVEHKKVGGGQLGMEGLTKLDSYCNDNLIFMLSDSSVVSNKYIYAIGKTK